MNDSEKLELEIVSDDPLVQRMFELSICAPDGLSATDFWSTARKLIDEESVRGLIDELLDAISSRSGYSYSGPIEARVASAKRELSKGAR